MQAHYPRHVTFAKLNSLRRLALRRLARLIWVFLGLLILVHPGARANSSGTGFFISPDGLLVTNHHVIEGAKEVQVQMPNGQMRLASPLVVDRANDLAIVQVQDVQRHPHLLLRHSSMMVRGSDVFTVGFPLVSIQGAEPKVTHGIVSSLTGFFDDPTMFQISVPLQAGNSGGPLVGMDGSVVGVVTSKLDAVKVQRATGDLPQNVSYAIKSAYLLELLNARAINGRVKPVSTPLLPVMLAEAVRRAEPAVVLIYALSTPSTRATPAESIPSSSPSAEPPTVEEESSTLTFGGVKFAVVDAYLQVSSIAPRNDDFRTTLRLGDRLLECVNYAQSRIYSSDDIKKCRGDFKINNQTSGDIYTLKVMRLGSPAIASIVLKSSP